MFGLYLSSALPDWPWAYIHILITNLGTSSNAVSSKFAILWYSIFIWCLKQSQIINNLLSFFCWYVDFFSSFSFSWLFVLLNEVILPTILFPIKSPVASAVFATTLFEAAFAASIPVFVAAFLILTHLLHLYLGQHLFFVLPNSIIVSKDNNSNVYPVFILKTVLFLILSG